MVLPIADAATGRRTRPTSSRCCRCWPASSARDRAPPAFALLVVANVASFAAYLVVYRVYLHLAGEAAARWALLLLVTYPFAFFQAAAYPESLMMLCGALAVWLALRGHHLWAGVALAVGVLARHIALFTGAALLTAQLGSADTPRRFLLNRATSACLPWCSLAGYCPYQYHTFGDALAFYHARTDPIWGERAWWGLRELLTTTERDIEVSVMYSYIPFALLPTIGARCCCVARRGTRPPRSRSSSWRRCG